MEDTPFEIVRFLRLEQVPLAIFAVLVAWLIVRLLTRFFDNIGERFTQRRIFLKQLAAISRFVIFLLAALFVVSRLISFSSEALLALGGSAALAFGFAFKDILASLIAGVILLFDRPFQVGDRISFEGHYGEVTDIGLRAVRLTTLDDNVVSIPNNKFLTDAVASANAGELNQMVVVPFYIGCAEDFSAAKRIVHDAAVSSRYVYLDKPVQVQLREGPVPGTTLLFALEVTLKAYVFDGRFETAFGTDVTERVKLAFKAKGIHTVGETLAAETVGA